MDLAPHSGHGGLQGAVTAQRTPGPSSLSLQPSLSARPGQPCSSAVLPSTPTRCIAIGRGTESGSGGQRVLGAFPLLHEKGVSSVLGDV